MPDESVDFHVFDASVWINVLATSELNFILESFGSKYKIPYQVFLEIKKDPVTRNPYPPENHPLLTAFRTKIITLSNAELSLFMDLISGPIMDRLGDGEASAIAVAVCRKLPLIVDERKARRIIGERFPQLKLLTSAELLQAPSVVSGLGQPLADKCFERARRFGRMQIHSQKP